MTVNRKRELVYFVRQYDERKKAGLPPVLNQMIEQAAHEAAGDVLAPFILRAACRGGTYKEMRMIHGIPCGKNMFYSLMKKFWTLLDESKYGV